MDDYDEKKMAFERDKAVFEQNCGQLRTLIPELHKKPLMAATLTGALLTAMSVFKLESRYTIGLFALIAVMNAFIGITCLRLRDVIESYIEKASLFSPDFGAKGGRPSKSSKPRSTPIFRPSIQAEKRNRWPITESLLRRHAGRRGGRTRPSVNWREKPSRATVEAAHGPRERSAEVRLKMRDP